MFKYEVMNLEVELLVHNLRAEGVKFSPKKVVKVQSIPTPSPVTEIESFLGLPGHYLCFISHFADTTTPLHAATWVKKRFAWNEKLDDAFKSLKEGMVSLPVMAYPDVDKPFIVEIDASKVGVGVVLAQKGGTGRLIVYSLPVLR